MTHFQVLGTAVAAALLAATAGCADGTDRAEAEEAGAAAEDSAKDSSDDDGALESSNKEAEEEQVHEEPEEPEPIPASSEGPAQNWPAPEPPEEIYEPTEEGAEALLQYWFDARHYARITGDTEPLEDVSHDECEMCDGHIDRIVAAHPDAWWVEEHPDEVHDSYVRLESDDYASGLFAHRSVPFEAYRQGTLDSEYSGGTDSGFGFALVFENDHWTMYDMSYIDEYEGIDPGHGGEDRD